LGPRIPHTKPGSFSPQPISAPVIHFKTVGEKNRLWQGRMKGSKMNVRLIKPEERARNHVLEAMGRPVTAPTPIRSPPNKSRKSNSLAKNLKYTALDGFLNKFVVIEKEQWKRPLIYE